MGALLSAALAPYHLKMDRLATEAADRARWGEELLTRGDYAEGFRLYDAWREVYPERWHDLPIPRWCGEDLNGAKFLITGEQGFGDQIMCARFAKLLQKRGAQVIWLCDPPLERLFNQCAGIPAASAETGGEFDGISYFCPSSGLPNLFFPPLSEPPGDPYLVAPTPSVVPGLTIGVVPGGNPKKSSDAARSLPADLAAELLALPGVVDLRPENTGARDFYDTASIIAGLDLVISVDTAVAHLAGAMGKPVWILLAEQNDWRWLRGRSDSPWYRSATLFRQMTQGDWRGPLGRVRDALAALA